jgi:hypothetical protein
MISGYGLENLMLDEAELNQFTPIIPYYDHGWCLLDGMVQSVVDSPSGEYFAWNQRMMNMHKSLNKKIFITGSPFVYFIDKYNIKKKKKKNTIFFLGHSTPNIRAIFNISKLLDDLNKLPDSLKPIDICLHYNDLNLEKIFLENGFKVRCAGNIISNSFPKKFFEILTDYNYSCSNILGTYVLYSLYINIPFFLIGDEITYDNFGLDKNVPRKYKPFHSKTSQNIINLFKKFNKKITTPQKKLIDYELGLKDKINKKDLKKIILKSLNRSLKNPLKSFPLIKSLGRTLVMKYKSF